MCKEVSCRRWNDSVQVFACNKDRSGQCQTVSISDKRLQSVALNTGKAAIFPSKFATGKLQMICDSPISLLRGLQAIIHGQMTTQAPVASDI